ncbi:hypothetical protein V6C27_12000 [Peptococcaceae bacterium 1198_IL3148]
MLKNKKSPVDEKKLSKKYRTNVSSLIRWWKNGKSDVEIATATGIDLLTLKKIKSEIEIAHRRQRLEQKKASLELDQASKQRQIFFRPLI